VFVILDTICVLITTLNLLIQISTSGFTRVVNKVLDQIKYICWPLKGSL